MSDTHYLVLSALGPDRPGLVAEVTEYLTDRGANIEDSRMVILGAEFGIMVLVSGTDAELSRVAKESAELEKKTGLGVLTRPTKSPNEHRRAGLRPFVITADALDQEGIVFAVADALRNVGVNVVSLGTETYEAPVTGSPLFRLEAHVDAPREVGLAQLRHAMDEVAREENIDIDVRPAGKR